MAACLTSCHFHMIKPHANLFVVSRTIHCVLTPQSQCFVKLFWHVQPAIGLILQLLCSPTGDRNFWQETKQNITTEGKQHSVHNWVRLTNQRLQKRGFLKLRKPDIKFVTLVLRFSACLISYCIYGEWRAREQEAGSPPIFMSAALGGFHMWHPHRRGSGGLNKYP